MAGFFGKFFIFSATLQAGQYVLAVVGILGSVISVDYDLRVIYTMYMVEPARDLGKPDRAPWATARRRSPWRGCCCWDCSRSW